MKKIIAVCAAFTLAACNSGGEAESAGQEVAAEQESILEGDAPGFEAVAPGTYQVTRSGDEAA